MSACSVENRPSTLCTRSIPEFADRNRRGSVKDSKHFYLPKLAELEQSADEEIKIEEFELQSLESRAENRRVLQRFCPKFLTF